MKKLIVLPLLCFAFVTQAQHYRPLHDSVYVQYQLIDLPFENGPNFAHFYPTFSSVSGNDSIFTIQDGAANWPLGNNFIKFSTPHRYAFVGTFDNDTCYIHTDYQQGVSWNYYKSYYSSENITATFADKQFYNFSGVSDSVIVIRLSTGDTIRISKHYGICNFRKLFSRNSPYQGYSEYDTITLVSMSNTPIQQPIYKPLEVFHYLTGETFYYKDGSYNRTWIPHPVVTETWTSFKLVVMNSSTSGDTVFYDFNWYEGLQFQNGPYAFRLRVTPEDAVVVSGNSFFRGLDKMFASTQSDMNYFLMSGVAMDIYKEYDQSADDDYVYVWSDEQGQVKRHWYDTDYGFYRYTETASQNVTHVTELWARYAPGTPDTDNLYLTSVDQMNLTSVHVYPVPCTNQLNIEGVSFTDMTVELTNFSGAIIPVNQYYISGNSISTGNLKPGVYILHLKNDSGVMTRMFLKE